MRNKSLLVIAILFASFSLNAQDAEKTVYEYLPYLDVSIGYVPNTDYNAGKASVSLNNFVLKRLGVYTSIEKGLDSDLFTHIIGGTVTVYKSVYLFAGADVITKRGMISNKSIIDGVRKELGIGFSPFKISLVRVGYSTSTGPTFAVGWKFGL